MPLYETVHHDPPAPIAEVSLRSQGGKVVDNVLLLLDTGADTTLLPRVAVLRLGITPDPSLSYALVSFDGSQTTTGAVDLDMIFLNKVFRGRYLLTDSDEVLGRDVLASVILLLDGPGQQWSQHVPAR